MNQLIRIIECLKNKYGEDLTLTFCKYVDGNNKTTLSRKIFKVEISEVNNEWLKKNLRSLSEREEIGLTSKVIIKNHIMHLALIDFKQEKWEIEGINLFLDKYNSSYSIFYSGNSYHGYIIQLFEEYRWIQFLIELLSINKEYQKEIVDTAWIGHSLVRGYSTLRWSNSTKESLRFLSYISSISNQNEVRALS